MSEKCNRPIANRTMASTAIPHQEGQETRQARESRAVNNPAPGPTALDQTSRLELPEVKGQARHRRALERVSDRAQPAAPRRLQQSTSARCAGAFCWRWRQAPSPLDLRPPSPHHSPIIEMPPPPPPPVQSVRLPLNKAKPPEPEAADASVTGFKVWCYKPFVIDSSPGRSASIS